MRSLLPLLLIMIWTAGADASDHDLPFKVYLDQNNLFCLEWGFDSQKGYITFKLTVNTAGWVGFGFSPNGGMAGADIVMGGLGPSGSYFKDYHATGFAMPVVDEQQSYTLLSASERDGQTILTFERTIQSCDDQDFHITTKSIKLIYAYGTTDEISYHSSRRGTKEVNLLNYMPRVTTTGKNYLTARVENISVPENETYYHCRVMKISNFKTKHHVYLVEPLIEHHDLIHHMLLYRCPSFVSEPYDNECYSDDVGDLCYEVVASWAVGGGVYVLPDNTGIPVGGEESEIFYRLEIHYNNPNNYKGRTDSSGLKLFYTDKLREHDAGTLMTGLLHLPDMDYKIPPNVAQFHSYGVCNTSAISQLVNPLPDLHVFAVLLHTHLAGRKVRVAHYRNKEQIDFLDADENYNYEYQQAVSLGAVKTIKPGDEIAVECTYSTAARTTATKLGLGTYDEMCLAFLLYYPAIGISSCISHPNIHYISPSTNNQIFEGTPSQDQISEYESLLKTVPQIQVVTDSEYNYTVYEGGFVREMMETPTVNCRNDIVSGSSRLCISWITFSLLLVVIM